MDGTPPGSSVHGISQQECWSRLPFPSLADLPDPRMGLTPPALAGRFSTAEPPEEPRLDLVLKVKKKNAIKNIFFFK